MIDHHAGPSMLSKSQQASLNLGDARELRDAGVPYRQIGRKLKLSSGQLAGVRRALKLEKAAWTRLSRSTSGASERDLPVSQMALPKDLKRRLIDAGLETLGDLANRLADPHRPGLIAISGIGPYRARLVEAMLDRFDLRAGTSDLQEAVEHLFPELR